MFLREEEERERQAEMERLKPIGTPVASYLEYRCKANPAALARTDHGDFVVDCRPWIRTGHSITQVGLAPLLTVGCHHRHPTLTVWRCPHQARGMRCLTWQLAWHAPVCTCLGC